MVCCKQSLGFPTADPQWPIYTVTNVVTNPVNGNDIVISSNTGNIFSTSDGGKTWFDIGVPSSFGLQAGMDLPVSPWPMVPLIPTPHRHRQPGQLHLRGHRDRPDL